ncbi:MAG: hypothetical protein HFJ85_07115 [Oscillospiraceae bacterium]|nr:hypothetical protein [Oscillospiraceae bacterium]
MLKGVSKQIVEIVNTENEYFEKAILFINPEKAGMEENQLREQAGRFVGEHARKGGKPSQPPHGTAWKNVLKIGCGALGGGLVSAFILLH